MADDMNDTTQDMRPRVTTKVKIWNKINIVSYSFNKGIKLGNLQQKGAQIASIIIEEIV